MKPVTAGTTIIGSRKTTVSRLLPRKLFTNSSASAKPSASSTETPSTVTTAVRNIAIQKPPPVQNAPHERSASQ